jgi:hypothetical protein
MAAMIPMFCAPEAVPRITLTSPKVSSNTIQNPAPALYPDATSIDP